MSPFWFAPTVFALAPLLAGALGAWLRWMSPGLAFAMFGTGIFAALVAAMAMSAAAAYATATGASWRPEAVRGAAIPLAIVVALLVGIQLDDAPLMNDVSTDLEDRPQFEADRALELNDAQRAALARRLEGFGGLQREAWPELGPVRLALDPDAAYARALALARDRAGWEITREDAAGRRFEATATTPGFGFVDDVVVRVRPAAGGSGARVDLRSRSRLGQGDFGTNAERVLAFSSELRAAADRSGP